MSFFASFNPLCTLLLLPCACLLFVLFCLSERKFSSTQESSHPQFVEAEEAWLFFSSLFYKYKKLTFLVRWYNKHRSAAVETTTTTTTKHSMRRMKRVWRRAGKEEVPFSSKGHELWPGSIIFCVPSLSLPPADGKEVKKPGETFIYLFFILFPSLFLFFSFFSCDLIMTVVAVADKTLAHLIRPSSRFFWREK